jgi:PGDYG protein
MNSAPHFDGLDLRGDPLAVWYVKTESVDVEFAGGAGVIASREGGNHYRAGDALVTGSNGDRWSVSRARFDARYEPAGNQMHGCDGTYRNKPLPVLARQIGEDFTVRRAVGGDLLQGRAGDWLLQYAPGDWGVVQNEKFSRVYRRADPA